MSPYLKNITGQRFGRLIVLSLSGMSKHSKALWLCECECGNKKVLVAGDLQSGRSKSCGCLRSQMMREKERSRLTSYNKREYKAWQHMISRCTDPKDPGFKNYGGRGIMVCERWLKSFQAFLDDMGKCPPGLMLDRVNNDGNYEPSNCRWTTRKVQNNNKRNTAFVTLNGVTKPITEWSESVGIPAQTIWWRTTAGWTPEAALSIPCFTGNRISK